MKVTYVDQKVHLGKPALRQEDSLSIQSVTIITKKQMEVFVPVIQRATSVSMRKNGDKEVSVILKEVGRFWGSCRR